MATSAPRRKRCRSCGESFYPNPRLGKRQRACSRAECQKARKQKNQADWLKRHPDYFTRRYLKVKQWLAEHPEYLANYRRRHPEYVQRDNSRRRERHQRAREARADIQDSISLKEQVLKELKPFLKGPAVADIQDSIRSDLVLMSLLTARFAATPPRRYSRLDRRRDPPPLPSPP